MPKFTEVIENRRPTYVLEENLPISREEATALVKEVAEGSPTAFSFQTQCVVFLFDDAHKGLWAMAEGTLKPLAPAEVSPGIQAKLQDFAAGAGTTLFFEDTGIVKNLQGSFPLYADNFLVWSEQVTGLVQANVWTALTQENIGTDLQHYNPVIGKMVAAKWSILANWNLCAQVVIGSIEAPADEKEYMEDSACLKEFN